MQQQSSVVWNGSIKKGAGEITTGSGAVKQIPYSYATRFDGIRGTNPEELIAAAHGACFTMALSGALTKKGYEIINIRTEVIVKAEMNKEALEIISSHLDVEVDVLGLSEGELRSIADEVKVSCPVSRALNLEISVEAYLKNK